MGATVGYSPASFVRDHADSACWTPAPGRRTTGNVARSDEAPVGRRSGPFGSAVVINRPPTSRESAPAADQRSADLTARPPRTATLLDGDAEHARPRPLAMGSRRTSQAPPCVAAHATHRRRHRDRCTASIDGDRRRDRTRAAAPSDAAIRAERVRPRSREAQLAHRRGRSGRRQTRDAPAPPATAASPRRIIVSGPRQARMTAGRRGRATRRRCRQSRHGSQERRHVTGGRSRAERRAVEATGTDVGASRGDAPLQRPAAGRRRRDRMPTSTSPASAAHRRVRPLMDLGHGHVVCIAPRTATMPCRGPPCTPRGGGERARRHAAPGDAGRSRSPRFGPPACSAPASATAWSTALHGRHPRPARAGRRRDDRADDGRGLSQAGPAPTTSPLAITPEELAGQVLYTIDQPWGVASPRHGRERRQYVMEPAEPSADVAQLPREVLDLVAEAGGVLEAQVGRRPRASPPRACG